MYNKTDRQKTDNANKSNRARNGNATHISLTDVNKRLDRIEQDVSNLYQTVLNLQNMMINDMLSSGQKDN